MAKPDKYSVGEVATQTEKVIYDAETKEPLDVHQSLAKILNDLEIIKSNLVLK
jgi:hypothetical protein